jgi:hypothetical protein
MEVIGKVLAILNENSILISSDVELKEGQEVKVAAVFDIKEKTPEIDLDRIIIPKGEVRVVMKQKDGIYVAQPFTVYKTLVPFSSIQKLLGPSLGSYYLDPSMSKLLLNFLQLSEREEIGKSAKIDPSSSLGLNLSSEVVPGDAIAR